MGIRKVIGIDSLTQAYRQLLTFSANRFRDKLVQFAAGLGEIFMSFSSDNKLILAFAFNVASSLENVTESVANHSSPSFFLHRGLRGQLVRILYASSGRH